MEIKTIKTKWSDGELKQNTYIVEFEDFAIMIDAGCSLEAVTELTQKPIKAMFITHGHFDHVLHIEEFDQNGFKIYGQKDLKHVISDKDLNVSYVKSFHIQNFQPIENDCVIDVDGVKVECYLTPGHSIDGVVYKIGDNLFSGDTVFSIAVGRTDLAGGNPQQLIESLDKIQTIDYKVLLPGHGRTSTKNEQIENIKKWQKFLKENKF